MENKEILERLREKGCGKIFHTDLIHKNGTKDKLVCICGGEDGLCSNCEANEEEINKYREMVK